MKILIVNLDNSLRNLYATSLIKGLRDEYDSPEIYWVCADINSKNLLKFNPRIKKSYLMEDFFLSNKELSFDLLINLHPSFAPRAYETLNTKEMKGFITDEDTQKVSAILFGGQRTKQNIFQVYYSLAGLSWAGQGYDLAYRPKSRCNPKRAGLALANANLRNFVTDNLTLKGMKICYIPFRKNILKRVDELNRCFHVVTDDLLTLSLGLALHKYVHYLKTDNTNMKIELFGQGQEYELGKQLV